MTSSTGGNSVARGGSFSAASFVHVLKEHDAQLRSVVWAVVRNVADVDDVMQASYEKAFRSLSSFENRSSLRTWLHSICYRTAINHVAHESRRRHLNVDDCNPIDSVPTPSEQALTNAELNIAFEVMDRDQRVAVMLVHGLGYSFNEAAEILGEKQGTVASRVGRAKKKLEKDGLL